MNTRRCVIGSFLGAAAFAALPAAEPNEPGPPIGERSLVVSGQGHFPVALRLQDGRIAAVVRGPGNHLGIDGRLDIVFSSDEGRTWSKPANVVDTPVDDRNAAFGQAKDGTLVVGYYRTATYDEQGKYNPKLDKPRDTWVERSSDGGATWKQGELDVSDIGWGSPFGKILTLPDDAMLMAIYGLEVRPAGQKNASDRNHSYVYRSSDHGQTWKRLAEIGDGKLQLNETALLRLPDGKIMAAVRSRAAEVWLSDSADDGRTWSRPRKLTPVNVHPADLCLLEDGRVLLTVGNRVGPFGVLGLVSDAAGQFDWSARFSLVDDALTRDCGYPSSVSLKDGQALTLYYATRVKRQPEWGVHCGALTYRAPRSNAR
ncbi:MAG: glycoside hydrolase [Verrucomicrobiota bacterium]|nr:glycoside hydrolase [Verrucomicrobiota bacterium]